jgi:hypothetical protein
MGEFAFECCVYQANPGTMGCRGAAGSLAIPPIQSRRFAEPQKGAAVRALPRDGKGKDAYWVLR